MNQRGLHLFGALSLDLSGDTIPLRTKKQQRWIALLAYLAVRQKPVRRQTLAGIIWGDKYDANERLRKHTLDELKHKIGSEMLEINAETVRLRTEDLWVDVNWFRQCLKDYRLRLSTQNDAQAALKPLEQAVLAYTGEFLGGYTLPESEEFYFWQIEQTNQLRQEFCTAAEELVLLLCARGDLDNAIEYANLWKQHDAENLSVHAWILALLQRAQKTGDADSYSERLRPLLVKWQKTDADLTAAREAIGRRLSEAHARSQQVSAVKERALTRLLNDQLNSTELVPAQENPSFFEGYLSVLSEMAQNNPLEAVKVAEEIADTLFDLNDRPAEARAVLDRAEAAILVKHQQVTGEARFRLLLQRMAIYRALGLTQQAVELSDLVAQDDALLASLSDQLKAAWYTHRGLIQCWVQGDYDRALESMLLSRRHFQLAGQLRAEAGILCDTGLIYWNQGQLPHAEDYLLLAKERASQVGNYRTLIKVIGNLGLLYLYQGNLDKAFACIEEHYQLAAQFNHLRETRRARGNRGIAKFHLGDYNGAIEDLEATIRAVRAVNEGTLHATINLSRCYRASGDREHGEQLAVWALEQAIEKQYPNLQIIARRALAETSDYGDACRLLQKALQSARSYRRIDEASCLLSLAQLEADPALSEAYRQQGIAILREMGAEAWSEKDWRQLPTL